MIQAAVQHFMCAAPAAAPHMMLCIYSPSFHDPDAVMATLEIRLMLGVCRLMLTHSSSVQLKNALELHHALIQGLLDD